MGDIGTFAYASTQQTEARFGAACLLVEPDGSHRVRTGFTRRSYIYVSRLVPAASESFVDDVTMAEIERALVQLFDL